MNIKQFQDEWSAFNDMDIKAVWLKGEIWINTDDYVLVKPDLIELYINGEFITRLLQSDIIAVTGERD